MPKYTALTPIKHDGKRYAVGATIDLNKAEEEAFQKSVGAVAGLCEACINIAPALK